MIYQEYDNKIVIMFEEEDKLEDIDIMRQGINFLKLLVYKISK